MNDDETAAILQTIEDCSEHTQCNVDDVNGLLRELRQQEKELTARLSSLDKTVQDLEALHHRSADEGGDNKIRDEDRAFVQDLLRVFDVQSNGSNMPIGFSGDIGSGPTTAYDALPPKKWKPTQG